MFNTIKNKLLKLSLEDFNKDFGHQMEMRIEVEESCQVNGYLRTDALLKIKMKKCGFKMVDFMLLPQY